jgi:hypothetical protein
LPTFKEDPAAYMRAWRARKRDALAAAAPAAAKPTVASFRRPPAKPRAPIPLGRPLTSAEKRDDAVLEAIEARGGQAVWTGKEWREAPPPTAARRPPPAPGSDRGTPPTRPFLATGSPNRNLTVPLPPLQGEVIPPPRSMIADGGAPPRRYAPNASVAEATAMIRAYAAQQAKVNEDMARRLAVIEREQAEMTQRLAAIEQRRTGIVAVVQGVASLFSLV